jgi:subtilisin-like proprotein convertase family protein
MCQIRFGLLFAALAGSLFLAGCGGSDPARPSAVVSQCALPLKYADGLSGGYSINSVAQAVPRQFTACAMEQALAASVSLCIDHPQMGELSAQLILPNQSSLDLDLQRASQGASCLISGRLFTVSLPASGLQPFSGLRGDWTVRVRDNDRVSNTPMGYLVGWSMQAEGL